MRLWGRLPIPYWLLAALFVGVWVLNYLTPMHSDDFSYTLKGFSFAQHWHHYMHWSGRLVADYISPILLNIPSKLLLALIQTLGLSALVVTVSWAALAYRTPELSRPRQAWFISFVALVFVLSTPHFGQIYLWVVGSANYLWPAVFYTLYLFCLIRYIDRRRLPTYIYPLALLAGCSNENAAVIVVGFTALVCFWQWWADGKLDWRLLAVFLLLFIGAAVLLAAPGNYLRLQHSGFDSFNALSLAEKASYHFFQRTPRVFTKSKLAYFLWLVVLFWLLFTDKKPRLFDDKKRPTAFALMLVFMGLAFGATAAQMLSPSGVVRAMMPSFVFLMFSLAFGVRALYDSSRFFRAFKRLVVFLTAVVVLIALEVFPTYRGLAKQEVVINRMLSAPVPDADATPLALPRYYIRWLVTSSYRIDEYYDKRVLELYHKRDIDTLIQPEFDYSVIDTTGSPVSTAVSNKAMRYWLLPERYLLDTVLVVEFDRDWTQPAFKTVQFKNWLGDHTKQALQGPVTIDGRQFMWARTKVPFFMLDRHQPFTFLE